MRPTALFTIGYEGLDVAAFIGRLRGAGVQTVVDVNIRLGSPFAVQLLGL